ncbi:MAG: hypothetical protein SGI88_21510, partial [Candidatus Hydrogenedentes bacterium]|nr:hypothetical protein [Candidatus Hydrogenedentota bacterium]
EASVRLRFQLNDPTLVPADLIAACIEDAHAEVERFLDADTETDPPDEALVTGETLLAGAYVFRAIAAKDAFAQRNVTIGGQRLEAGERFRALTAVAALTEKQAWFLLEPYLTEQPARLILDSTPTTPVIGEA